MLQAEMARVKEDLGSKTVTAESGGGLVKCVANGKGDVVSLEIDPGIVAVAQKKMLEDLVVAAVNLSIERARQLAQDEIVRATGGLPMPPGFFGT
jgi:DNA-binding YbaB/EbfC family protein